MNHLSEQKSVSTSPDPIPISAALTLSRMRPGSVIGIDLDNTLICYDQSFARLAIELGLLPDLPASRSLNKAQLKAHFIDQDQQDTWTHLQGLMYGPHLPLAEPFPDALTWIQTAKAQGMRLRIVSHKTKTPYRGELHNLHAAAMQWLQANHFISANAFGVEAIHFELTKENKLARIQKLNCDYFIDDLNDILVHPKFPANCQPILFGDNPARKDILSFNRWHVTSSSNTDCSNASSRDCEHAA